MLTDERINHLWRIGQGYPQPILAFGRDVEREAAARTSELEADLDAPQAAPAAPVAVPVAAPEVERRFGIGGELIGAGLGAAIGLVAKLARAERALRSIASCTSSFPGDVVSIAQAYFVDKQEPRT